MKSKINARLVILGFFVTVIFSNCVTMGHYDFSLKNTVSIFLLNNGKDYFFCMPLQYIGDYKIESFEFAGGTILIGDYELSLKRDDVNIYVYLDEAVDEFERSDGEFNLVYSWRGVNTPGEQHAPRQSGGVLVSKMGEPLTIKQDSDGKWNYYYIFIERHLKDDEMKKIINEYEKGNVYSKYSIWYDITIDNEEQNGSGILDDFELYNGPVTDDPTQLFPNLDFFRVNYLKK